MNTFEQISKLQTRCVECNSFHNLEIHHRIFKSQGDSGIIKNISENKKIFSQSYGIGLHSWLLDDIENLVVLCDNCHRDKIHSGDIELELKYRNTFTDRINGNNVPFRNHLKHYIKMTVPKEDDESKALVKRLEYYDYKFTHIANETGLPRRVAMIVGIKRKSMGLSPGVPDYMIILKNGKLLFIELKRQREYGKKGQLLKVKYGATPEQLEWIRELNEVDNVYGQVCYGYAQATDLIIELEAK